MRYEIVTFFDIKSLKTRVYFILRAHLRWTSHISRAPEWHALDRTAGDCTILVDRRGVWHTAGIKCLLLKVLSPWATLMSVLLSLQWSLCNDHHVSNPLRHAHVSQLTDKLSVGTEGYILSLPQNTLSYLWSLSLDSFPHLLVLVHDVTFAQNVPSTSVKHDTCSQKLPCPCHFSIWLNAYFLNTFYQYLWCTFTINLLICLIHCPVSCFVCVCVCVCIPCLTGFRPLTSNTIPTKLM